MLDLKYINGSKTSKTQAIVKDSEPLKPLLQIQIKEPGVFWHVASVSMVLMSQ